MAIVGGKTTKDEDKKNQPKTIGAPAGGSAPSGGGQASAGNQAIQQGGPQKPSSSGQFTDVGKFVDANKPNIKNFAQGSAKGFQDEVSGIKSGAAAEASGIKKNIESNKLDSSGYEGKTATDLVSSGFNQNVTLPGKEDTSLANSRTQAAKAQATADSLDSMGGRGAFLREQLSPNVRDYSAGENRLDTIFTMRDQGARDTFKDTQQSAADLSGDIATQEQGIADTMASTQAHNDRQRQAYAAHLDTLGKDITSANQTALAGRSDPMMQAGDKTLRGIWDQSQRGPSSTIVRP